MMVISASGVVGVATVKNFKGKWRPGGRKTMVGQRTASGKTVPWTVIISLFQRCAEREKKDKERYGFLVFLEAVCTAFGNCMV